MCMICVDYQKGLLTAKEAARNYHEMAPSMDPAHAAELADKIQLELLAAEFDEMIKDGTI